MKGIITLLITLRHRDIFDPREILCQQFFCFFKMIVRLAQPDPHQKLFPRRIHHGTNIRKQLIFPGGSILLFGILSDLREPFFGIGLALRIFVEVKNIILQLPVPTVVHVIFHEIKEIFAAVFVVFL